MHNVPLPQDNLGSGGRDGRGRAARHVRHAVYVNGTALRPQPRTQIQVALALSPVSLALGPQGPAPALRNKLEVQFNLRNLDASSLCKTRRRRRGIPPKSVCRAFTWKWSHPLPFLHLYRGDAAPFPFPSQWDTRHPSLQRDTGKTTRKRLHSRVDHCLWQVDKGLQATDRLDTHYDAPTYLRVPTAWHSRGLFVRGLAAADKAEWGRRRPD